MSVLLKRYSLLFVLFILLIPTFWSMLKPGIFSMHDFHLIRLFEFRKCIEDLQIPCRWAPDAAFEYGQPMFNYYTQAPYVFGEIFHLLGFQVIDTLKILFILSLIFSAVSMYFLSRQIWKNDWAAILSALIYTYAPYRAVDVWVRGALPEALSFIFFPLITYFFNDFILTKKTRSLLLFTLSFAGLVLTHNLSALMYSIFLLFWGIYFITYQKAWKQVPKLIFAGLLSIGLSAFYILPVATETKLISLQQTTGGYYDFRNHFVSLYQLLIQRYWGYGASLWGEDDRLSLSVGYIQWILPTLILVIVIATRKIKKMGLFLAIFAVGWIMLFLTHSRSAPLWEIANKPLSYVQFPWRFLGSAVFAFALSCGAISLLPIKRLYLILTTASIAIVLILINLSFFKEDIWYYHKDSDEFTGSRWEFHVSSALSDFWPKTSKELPKSLAPKDPSILEGSGSARLLEKRSNRASYHLNIESKVAKVEFPIVYFPNWKVYSDNKELTSSPSGNLGLITTNIEKSEHLVNLKFENTGVRVLGNYISLFSSAAFAILIFKFRK